MDRHVLFLGAGASKGAGYPLTDDLLLESRCYAEKHRGKDFLKAFEEIEKIKNDHTIFDETLLAQDDVELFFTFPDILKRIHKIKDNSIKKKLCALPDDICEIENDLAVNKIYDKYQVDKITKIEKNFQLIKLAIEELLFENSCYQNILPPYFYKMTSDVDCIISTNWDAVAERVLFNNEQWSPADGYGFSVNLADFFMVSHREKSRIKILKLHGGIGWHLIDRKITLTREFLDWLTDGTLHDINACLGNDEIYMQFPSFAKELTHPEVIKIWQQADRALHNCNRLTVVGHRLPDSDTNIRALLLAIRGKCKRKKFKLKIIIGSAATSEDKKLWKDFLECDDDAIICQNAESYFG